MTMTPRDQQRSALSVHRRRFSGRAEHLSSGDNIHFSSLKELLAFIAARLEALPGGQALR
jgi:hypothetical protein